MVNFVLIIPKQTLNALLVSWLSMSDVGKLDSALCDRACRDIFEHSLALRNFGPTADKYCASSEFICWVINRKIKLDMLHVGVHLLRRKNEKLRLQLLENVGPTLRRAVISCGNKVKFNSPYFTEDRKCHNTETEFDSSSESDFESSSESDSESSSESDSESSSAQDDDHVVETKLTDEVIVDLSIYCTQLKAFSVHEHHSGSVVSLLQMNPKLDSVTLNNSPKVLRHLRNICPDISCLTITERASLLDLERFALNVPLQLKKLCLLDTDIKRTVLRPLLQQASLIELRLGTVQCNWASLSNVSPNLQVFRCALPSGTDKIDLITRLAIIMPNLRTLVLLFSRCDCRAVTVLLETVLANFPALRQFCTEHGCEEKLSTLDVDAAQEGQSQSWDGFVLEELFLNNLGYLEVENTISKCQNLRTLGVSSIFTGGPEITRCAVKSVKKLVSLSMVFAHTQDYAKLFKNLLALDLAGCSHLTDKELLGIAKNCSELTLLHVHDAPKVTLQGALTVLKVCPHIQSLEFACEDIDGNKFLPSGSRAKNSAIAAAVELCKSKYPQLQHLWLCFGKKQ